MVKEVVGKERGGLIMKSPSTIVLHCNDPKLDRVGNSGRAKETQQPWEDEGKTESDRFKKKKKKKETE